ncbi:endolytic transglycosylase MltG [Marinihelvus fidelis]|uniref:Endolytic murein transglycosylase n=1 Tax=Marinihelvus fidelis TaxID=2613842 RepID=A0A5N0TFH3_9GAMM|nr:endolytic transglycosylase MltG [Marinihelvus fidelis]KAA9132009.1 endolytic transglycosylase MltG [Marinihelvus fidelis]
MTQGSRWSAGRVVVVALLSLVVLLAGVAAFGWGQYRAFLDRPLDVPAAGLVLEVQRGDHLGRVVEYLETQGATRNDWRWRLLARLQPATIQAGEFMVPAGTRPLDLVQRLESGEVIQHRFTIVEGWRYRDLAKALLAEPRLAVDPALLAEDAVMATIGAEEAHPEGWFLPETYAWVAGDTAIDLLRRAHGAMRDALAAEWSDRDPDAPLDSAYELLILASIVEKETAVASERAEVAGVFARRLSARWRLETDPTVIYGLGDQFDGDIRYRDLRADTPYNTYTRYGLPPTPIALPGRKALAATARPAAGTAMFFVADGRGGHVFSDTLEEHNRAVRAYLDQTRDGG